MVETGAMAILLLIGTVAVLAIGPGAEQFRVGPGGVRVQTAVETYEDQHHRRHEFLVPKDWRDYHHPLGWYRVHREWWRESDWYRRSGRGIDAAAPRNESRG
jgi:hypothetical protein